MTTYNIVYKGNILEGHDITKVETCLIMEFGLDPEKATRLLSSGRVIIKRNLDKDTAQKYGMAMKKAGLNVVLIRYMPPPKKEKETIVNPSQKTYFPIEFNGIGSEYFKIWIINLILSIITLGIYSAWAKVRRKQYFYGNVILNGSSFEYLANPVNILKGRIIVVIFFIIYSLISKFYPLASTVMSLLFIVILPWLVVRSLAFNARNSAYKNIRFGFNGTIKEAAKVYLMFPLLVPLTLGILSPYVYFRQKKFMVENSSYGKTPFIFTATHKEYYRLVLKALIPTISAIVLTALAGMFLPPAAGLVFLVLYLYLFAYFSVASTNLLYNSALLDRHEFKADMETKDYLILITGNTLASVLTLGIFYPWAHIRTLRYRLDHLTLVARGDLDHFVVREHEQVSALGDEAGNLFDLDIGL